MNTVKSTKNCTCTMETRLARLGANIDQLVNHADQTKQHLKELQHDARERGVAALEEFKQGLDKAWFDVARAWDELRYSGEKAKSKLSGEIEKCEEHDADQSSAY